MEYLPLIPNTSLHLYSPVSVVSSLVSTYIYLFSVTSSLRPDEVATVWWLQKLVYKYLVIALFQQIRSYYNMNTNKVSNLFKYLKDKYGEENVRLPRFWEFTVKKMADHRNHRRFMLRCIKVRDTLVSCRIRNPLYVKTNKNYQIIQKAERQLLYERVRNLNSILYMYEHNKAKCYLQLRNLISDEDSL